MVKYHIHSGILRLASYQGSSSNSHPYFPACWRFIPGLISIILYVSPAFRIMEHVCPPCFIPLNCLCTYLSLVPVEGDYLAVMGAQ